MNSPPRRWPGLSVCFAVVGCTILVPLTGCSPPEEIRTYTVKKQADAPAPTIEAPQGAIKSRILGGIIPIGNGGFYFLKFTGPVEKIDPHEKQLFALLSSIRLDDVRKAPTYTVPEGWKESGGAQMRLMSFNVGTPGTPDPYISTPLGGSLLDNVNRWRKEVGLADVTESQLPQVAPEILLGSKKAYKVDFRGPGGAPQRPMQGR